MQLHQRLGYAVGLLAGALVGMTAEAAPIAVELATSTLELTCGGVASSQTSTKKIHTGFCERTVDANTAFVVAEAFLETPEVFVQTNTGGSFSAIGTTTIFAEIRVNETATPPVPTPIVDIGAFTSGEVSLFGPSFGSVRVSLDGPMHADTTLALGPPNFDDLKISVGVVPDEVYTVTLRAHCQSAAGGTCVAVLDPDIFLDQAAFDARLGSSSFPLASFYALEISANIGPAIAVLEPPTFLLIGFALVGLGFSRRRKLHSRRPIAPYRARLARHAR